MARSGYACPFPLHDPDRKARLILARIAAFPAEPIDLAEAALALAHLEHPGSGWEFHRLHLTALAADIAIAAERPDIGLDQRALVLHRVVFGLHGYDGDSLGADDPRNANLMHAIDRRRGLPITLAILLIHAARAQGWPIEGIDFPGHFLVRLEDRGQRLILNPSAQGRVVGPAQLRALLKSTTGASAEMRPEHCAAIDDRHVLLRLQNTLKVRRLRAGELTLALQAVELMLLFAPDQAALWREAGMIHARLGNRPAAVAALETFLDQCPNDETRTRAIILLRDLRDRH